MSQPRTDARPVLRARRRRRNNRRRTLSLLSAGFPQPSRRLFAQSSSDRRGDETARLPVRGVTQVLVLGSLPYNRATQVVSGRSFVASAIVPCNVAQMTKALASDGLAFRAKWASCRHRSNACAIDRCRRPSPAGSECRWSSEAQLRGCSTAPCIGEAERSREDRPIGRECPFDGECECLSSRRVG